MRSRHRTLTVAFLARFFESETAAGPADPGHSLFWLVAFLATPGICLPLFMTLEWNNLVADHGAGFLRVVSLVDKTMYLGLSFVTIGLVSAFIWHTLMVDRRDGLVLGPLPVSPRAIYTSKLTALVIYVVLLSIGMHAPAALLYGVGLGAPIGAGALVRNAAALVAAGTAVNAFVFMTVTSLQSTCLAVLGPRWFSRVSPVLQIATVAAATLVFLSLSALSVQAPTLAGPAAGSSSLLWLPPFWFLGVYEAVAGTGTPTMLLLAGRAIAALTASASLLVLTYPLACHRALKAAIEGAVVAGPTSRRLGQRLTQWLARDPHQRGLTQFLLSAVSRTSQNRLVLCVFAGIGVAVTMPVVSLHAERAVRSGLMSDVALLVAPLLLMCALGTGLRIAVALPSELRAAWIFPAMASPMLTGRRAARRVLLAFSIGAPIALALPAWLGQWGLRATLGHAVACGLGGAVLVDVLLWGFIGVPCAKPMAPARANLQFRWPAIALGVFLFTYGFATWQIQALARWGVTVMLAPVALACAVVARASQDASIVNEISGDPAGPVALNLDAMRERAIASRESHA